MSETFAVHLYGNSQLITAKNYEKTLKYSENKENNNEKEKKSSQKCRKVYKKHVKSI